MIDDLRASQVRGFLRPALLLAACIVVVALLLAPFALGKEGSGGLGGLMIAAVVCLIAGLLAEALACFLHGTASPLAVMLLGMAIRMAPPLGICMALALRGMAGRDHLAFICYLLTFYLVTLALETWLTVTRVARDSSNLKHNAH